MGKFKVFYEVVQLQQNFSSHPVILRQEGEKASSLSTKAPPRDPIVFILFI